MTTVKIDRDKQAFLKEETTNPAYSFFFRLHSGSEKQLHDKGHIRNRCHETFKESGLQAHELEQFEERADKLIDHLNFQTGAKSVGLFVSSDASYSSNYFINIPERQYVGEYFSGYESIYAAQESEPYLLFLLEPSTIHAYIGQATHLQILPDCKELDRLLTVYKQRSPMLADKDGKGRKGKEFDQDWKTELFKAIASVSSSQHMPVCVFGLSLAGSDEVELKASGVDVLIASKEVHQRTSPDDLRHLSEDLLEQVRAKRAQELVDRCRSAMGAHRLASGLDEMLILAKEGRAEVLILETPSWSTIGRTEFSKLHEAIRETIARHGKVEFVPEGTLVQWNGAAMLLRY